jgi:hypothetical protein
MSMLEGSEQIVRKKRPRNSKRLNKGEAGEACGSNYKFYIAAFTGLGTFVLETQLTVFTELCK